MGIGPVSACRRRCSAPAGRWTRWTLSKPTRLLPSALAVGQLLEWDSEKVNVNGGAIAGPSIGASGCRILVSTVHEMQRRGASKGWQPCASAAASIAMTLQR